MAYRSGDYIMPFGKHKGEDIATIDTGYLRWVDENCENISEGLRNAITGELAARESDESRQGRVVKRYDDPDWPF